MEIRYFIILFFPYIKNYALSITTVDFANQSFLSSTNPLIYKTFSGSIFNFAATFSIKLTSASPNSSSTHAPLLTTRVSEKELYVGNYCNIIKKSDNRGFSQKRCGYFFEFNAKRYNTGCRYYQ